MSENQEAFRQLMQRIRDGSEDAVREFIDRYGPEVLRVVRRRLDRRLRAKYDSVDFTQDVWASFFAHQVDNSFEAPEALVRFLVRMAYNKVVDGERLIASCKPDGLQEHSLEEGEPTRAEELFARQPTPSQVVGAEEEWERLLATLTSRERLILTMLRMGYTQREIAVKACVTVRTIRRVVEKVTPGYVG